MRTERLDNDFIGMLNVEVGVNNDDGEGDSVEADRRIGTVF